VSLSVCIVGGGAVANVFCFVTMFMDLCVCIVMFVAMSKEAQAAAIEREKEIIAKARCDGC
jgi:hypothetical protein